MRLNHVLAEEQINELGLLKKIGAGVSGAVSGFKASQSARGGREHSDRIVANLKKDFMQMVGGGHPATYDNLVRFLGTHGLQDLDQIANPLDPHGTGTHTGLPPANTPASKVEPTLGEPTASTGAGDRVEPTMGPEVDPKAGQANLKARLKTGQGIGQKTGTGFKKSRVGVPVQKLVGKNPDGSPKFSVVRELAGDQPGVLNNAQIDNIIKAAVKSNYHRIKAAQRGIPYNSYDQAQAQQQEEPAQAAQPQAEPAAVASPTATNPFSDPDKLLQDWQAYLSGGGQKNPKIQQLAQEIMGAKVQAPKPKKQKVKPAEPKVKPPEATKPTQAELDADHERLASGSNEGYSRFLGMKL